MKNRKFSCLLALALTVICVLFACGLFSGCTYSGHFFDKKHLQTHLVDDLPKPPSLWVNNYGSYIIYVTMSKEKFDKYVETVYEYLLSRDFKRFGTHGEVASSLIGMQYYANTDVSELSDFYITETYSSGKSSGSYIFVWANEMGQLYQSSPYTTWLSHYLKLSYNADKKQMRMEMCYTFNPYLFAE